MIKINYRLLAFILSLLMLCSSCIVCVTAEETEKVLIDSTAFDALNTMGLLGTEFSQMAVDDDVTRAIFAGNASNVAGYIISDVNMAENPFIDVNSQTIYKDEICNLYNMGIINGTSENTFDPNEKITYAQAFKMVIDILGYREYTKAKYGEYPNGYIMTATRLDLTADIETTEFDTSLKAVDAVQLLYNAGITPVMEPSSFSLEDETTYHINGEKLLLAQNNRIYSGEGIMMSNGIASLIEGRCDDGRVIIGDEEYLAGDKTYTDLLGCIVEYFYKEDNGKGTLLWATPTEENDIIALDCEELIQDDPAYSITNVIYWKGVKRRSLSVDKYADIIYNNSISYDGINPESGTLRFIDNDNDGIYEVVIIEEYSNVFVTAISSTGNFIGDKYGNTLFLDDYDNIHIYKDGNEIGLDEIEPNRILSYISSQDKKHLWIYVNDKGRVDTLKSIANREGKKIYSFNEGEYTLSFSYKKLMEDGVYTVEEPRLGSKYVIYFDKAGNIAELERVDNEILQYALLIDAIPNKDVLADKDSVSMRILLKSGVEASVNTEKQITLNGVKGKSGLDFLKDSRVTQDGEIIQQVIQVTLNGDGNVTEIKLAEKCTSEYGYDDTEFTLDYETQSGGISGQFAYFLDGRYTLTGDTVCFKKTLNSRKAVDYQVVSHYYAGGSVYSLYDCDSNLIPGAIFVKADANGTGFDNYMLLIDSVEKTMVDGEVRTRVNAYSEGKLISYLAMRDDVVPEDIKRGDIVKFGVYDQQLIRMDVVYRLSEKPESFTQGLNSTWAAIYGDVYSIGSNSIVTLCGESMVLTTRRGNGLMNLQIYDAKNDIIYPGTINDIQLPAIDKEGNIIQSEKNAKIFLFQRYTYFRDAVIVYY